jgi:light-regulated signal transduction histidine kinase (bacteriophytochrome)
MACADPLLQQQAQELLTRFPLDPQLDFGSPKSARIGKSELLRELTDEVLAKTSPEYAEFARKAGWKSAIYAPLASHNQVLGALALVRDSSLPPFSIDELTLAEELARRAALAIDNANLYATAQRERAEAQNALTALERAEARLRRSNEELQQFAYIASHDLQEPLRTVSVFAELLSRRYASADPEIKFLVETVTSGARRMHSLVHDLLAYSRLGGGEDLQPIDTAKLVQSCLESLSVTIAASGASITLGELPVVTGTPQLAQVFQNLIANAIKYRGPDPPRIHIAADRNNGEWRFAISDNGIGIKPEYSSRIFEIFRRLHGRDVPGTGIGLAVCKKVIESCGGRIWVDSEPGRGSTFWFTLPVCPDTL